ncbi:glycosyltransferase [Sphingomonas sp.]|uniref:glycosyltransferase n=1 Tax=Sphingomonas sp. TaxID=28214 RepID=UPI002DD67F9F|nr:glycosyltransferase [Sphingomonas sp.]
MRSGNRHTSATPESPRHGLDHPIPIRSLEIFLQTPRHAPVILHVISGLRTGGAERALYRLVSNGLARAFDTHVVSMDTEGTYGAPLRNAGAVVHALDARQRPARAAARLAGIARTLRPDLIQGWMYHGNAGALLAHAATRTAAPLLWNIRQGLDDIRVEGWGTRQAIRANRLFSRRPRRILYNSYRSREQHEAYGFAGHGGQIIPNGFDTDAFLPDPDRRARCRTTLGISQDVVLVGHFARLHPMKDHAGLLGAANIALHQGMDAQFLLVGTEVSPAATDFETLVAPDFRDRFHFLGERSDIPDLMQAIDLYVSSSSRAEGFPNVIGEAMAAGVPCIGTDIGDTGRVIGTSGIVIPPSDASALAAALIELAPARSRRLALGQAARRIIKQTYSIDAVVDRYIDLYQSVVSDSREKR